MNKKENIGELPLILVTGANGQLGQTIKEISESYPDFRYMFTDWEDLDITQIGAVSKFFRDKNIDLSQFEENPFILINAAAYTNVDKAEDDMENCDNINNRAVASLARECMQLNGLMIHISSDYVYDGENNVPYKEDDIANPLSVYGRSKLCGDEAIINIMGNRGIVIRTSWLYSDYGNNFVSKMIEMSFNRDTISVVTDQVGSPTYSTNLAVAIMSVLIDGLNHRKFPYNIVNYGDSGVCSWYDLASMAIRYHGNPSCTVYPITTEEYPTKAVRPKYSLLSKQRFDRYYRIKRQHWTLGLEKYSKKI